MSASDRQSIARNAAAMVVEQMLVRNEFWHMEAADKFRRFAADAALRAQIMYEEVCRQVNRTEVS